MKEEKKEKQGRMHRKKGKKKKEESTEKKKRNMFMKERGEGSIVAAGLELSNRSFQEILSRIPCQDLSLRKQIK